MVSSVLFVPEGIISLVSPEGIIILFSPLWYPRELTRLMIPSGTNTTDDTLED
jgi:hypothetical protein